MNHKFEIIFQILVENPYFLNVVFETDKFYLNKITIMSL